MGMATRQTLRSLHLSKMIVCLESSDLVLIVAMITFLVSLLESLHLQNGLEAIRKTWKLTSSGSAQWRLQGEQPRHDVESPELYIEQCYQLFLKDGRQCRISGMFQTSV